MPLSDTTRDAAERLVRRYPVARSALLPLLHLVQADQGHVTDEGIAFCADALGLTKAEVGAVATFYTMFKREPVGDWLISVCTNPTCKIAGGQAIYERFSERLGGHHDPDTGVSVEHAECLGICDAAPVVQVNYEMYGPLPEDGYDAILEGCRTGEPPVSGWSGEVPRTFREVEWDLSGAGDGWDAELVRASRQQVEAEVPPAYRTGETDIPVTHPGGDPRGVGGEVFRERRQPTADTARVGARASSGDEQDAAAVDGTTAYGGGGVAAERESQVAGPTTEASPAVADQPRTEPEGDQPAEATGETVDVDDTAQAGAKAGSEEDAPHTELPEMSRRADTAAGEPDLADDQARSAAEGETEPLDERGDDRDDDRADDRDDDRDGGA